MQAEGKTAQSVVVRGQTKLIDGSVVSLRGADGSPVAAPGLARESAPVLAEGDQG